jgi:hypothetical protein
MLLELQRGTGNSRRGRTTELGQGGAETPTAGTVRGERNGGGSTVGRACCLTADPVDLGRGGGERNRREGGGGGDGVNAPRRVNARRERGKGEPMGLSYFHTF